MEVGIYSFADLTPDPVSGVPVAAAERMRQLLDYARIADAVGLDIFGVGEHHGAGFANSATATTIAALSAVTRNIRFTSASTLLSTADPVRTYQEFATADLISGGRVEIVFGRGAFTENFPLFGFDLADYDALFVEKLKLFDLLNRNAKVTWSGRFRPPLQYAEIAPRAFQPIIPVSIGALSEESVLRAAKLGYPLAMPLLGGTIPGYARLAELYRDAWIRADHDEADIRIAAFSHLHVAPNSQDARENFYPYYAAYLRPLFRGLPIPRHVFDQFISREGALVAGSVAEVTDKLAMIGAAIDLDRYVGQIDIGGQQAAAVAEGIDRLGQEIAPKLR